MQLLAPTSRVTQIGLPALRRSYDSIEALSKALEPFDFICAQPIPPEFLPPGDADLLGPRIARFPTIIFPAFHPDAVYVGDLRSLAQARLAPSPVGHYHSAIALFAFLEGLDEAKTLTLFRENVFSRLGYMDGWQAAADELLSTAEAASLGLANDFLRWSRRGSFMHVINHPKIPVLGDVARRLLQRLGIAAAEIEVADYLPDDLAYDVVWPVYPAIAERYGIAGSTLFKARAQGSRAPKVYDLPAFITESFRLYRSRPRIDLTCQRVDFWQASPEIRALFH